jgi:WD40 repeat protein
MKEGKDWVKNQVDTGETIDCVQYSQDGTLLAVSFRNFTVKIYNTDDLSPMRDFDLTLLCGSRVEQFQNVSLPTLHRLSFSYDGRYLATSACDGYVRIWTVPKMLSLQEWCRKGILQYVPLSKVTSCNFPQKIKSFLLSHDLCQQGFC